MISFPLENLFLPKMKRRILGWVLPFFGKNPTNIRNCILLLLKQRHNLLKLIRVAIVTPREEQQDSFERLRRAVKCPVEIRVGERVVSEVWSVAKSRVVYQARLYRPLPPGSRELATILLTAPLLCVCT